MNYIHALKSSSINVLDDRCPVFECVPKIVCSLQQLGSVQVLRPPHMGTHYFTVRMQTYPPVQTNTGDTFGLTYESAKHKVCNLKDHCNTKK